MSNGTPQVEDGYTRIANELLEALCRCPLLNENTRTLFAVMRKTYGYGKKDDVIALSQIEELTGLPRRSVKRARKRLEDAHMLMVSNLTPHKPLCIGINKTYSQWKVVSNLTLVSKSVKGGVKSAPTGGVKSAPHKRYSKDIIQKKTSKVFDLDGVEMRLSQLLLSLIRQRDSLFKQPDLQKWAKHIDGLLRIDKRPAADVEKVIRWCQAHGNANFSWATNILSTNKLREKFSVLYQQMQNEHKPQTRKAYTDSDANSF